MTLKEKLAEMMPERINAIYSGGVKGCPTDYNFLNVTEIDCSDYCDDCKKCWNTEFVEEEKEEMTLDEMINRLQDNPCMCDGASDSNCEKCIQNNLQLIDYLEELRELKRQQNETKANVEIKEENSNAVDHPTHYQGKHECIDEMIALFGVEAVKGFCKCNVHKYRYRAKAKNGQEDLDKADWYMSKLMELEEISVEDSKVDFTTTTYFK